MVSFWFSDLLCVTMPATKSVVCEGIGGTCNYGQAEPAPTLMHSPS
jgi:hypothetical protein